MIRIYRKLREDLLSEGKTRKYLKYAIGEVLLVVIGILIALQVNNWNEDRKLRNEAQRIFESLNAEFRNNRKILKDRIDLLEHANKYVKAVLDLTGREESHLATINIDSIINLSLNYGNYNPANSSIQEIISSGKLNLIKNNQLKDNLFQWIQTLEDTDEDFKNQDLQSVTMLETYLVKKISFKNGMIYHPLNYGDGESNLFDKKYEHMFNDLEFENLYYGKRFWNQIMINHYKELDNIAKEIINQTE